MTARQYYGFQIEHEMLQKIGALKASNGSVFDGFTKNERLPIQIKSAKLFLKKDGEPSGSIDMADPLRHTEIKQNTDKNYLILIVHLYTATKIARKTYKNLYLKIPVPVWQALFPSTDFVKELIETAFEDMDHIDTPAAHIIWELRRAELVNKWDNQHVLSKLSCKFSFHTQSQRLQCSFTYKDLILLTKQFEISYDELEKL